MPYRPKNMSPEEYLAYVKDQYGVEDEHYELTEEEFQSKLKAARETMRGHNWRQQGTEVFCSSCPFRHGFYVSTDQRLIGIDSKGDPQFKKGS